MVERSNQNDRSLSMKSNTPTLRHSSIPTPMLPRPAIPSRTPSLGARLLLALAAPAARIGGQAVIEGVMMRSKHTVGWAVRRPDGEIVVEKYPFVSASKRFKLLKLPVARGAVSLFESLSLGLKALSRSADIAGEETGDAGAKTPVKDRIAIAFSMLLAFALAFGVFLYLPMKMLSFFVPEESALAFNLFAGAIRVAFFVAYLLLISMLKDIRRVFEYHGAEHKAIAAYEAGVKLTSDAMKPFRTHHPRCGTSFILVVTLICVFMFALVDALIIHFSGPYPTVLARVLTHLVLLPAVSGASYEVLRFSSEHHHVFPVNLLVAPGLWLQRITTREPDDEQMGIAATALEAVL
ncbi:MAG: DUF1385 domain-containing protein [Chitinivibrionales bacterium]|nr:DUF1385 domain-containing protein [Chitinivibrionales bacterium]